MPHKLLLADDSVTIQRVIELTFADEDITVFAVGDGQQAVERIEADPPDIILADVGMPKRDGYEVAAFVKSRPKLSHIPVLLLTGAFEPVDQARAISVGCDGVLAKPFEPQMVINRVKELLSAKRQGASHRTPAAVPVLHEVDSGIVGGNPKMEDIHPPPPEATGDSAVDMSIDAILSPVGASDPNVSLDDYFDQLDTAFSKLGGSRPHRTSESAGLSQGQDPLRQQGAGEFKREPPPSRAPVTESDLDFSGLTGIEHQEQDSRQEEFRMAQANTQVGAVHQFVPDTFPAAPAGPTLSPPPPIADVFAALLAAEQEERPAAKPAAAGPSAPASPVITDAVIDQVVTRVLERLSDKLTRETVAEIVPQVAERLVREEIERIKGGKK